MTIRCGSLPEQFHSTIMKDVDGLSVEMGEDAGKKVRYREKSSPKVLVACIDWNLSRPRRWNDGTTDSQLFWFETKEGHDSCIPGGKNPDTINALEQCAKRECSARCDFKCETVDVNGTNQIVGGNLPEAWKR